MSLIKNLINYVFSFVFPNTCVNCGEIIPEGEFFCDFCFEGLERIPLDKLCLKCGNPKNQCYCKSRVYAFDSVTAPFYKSGAAERAMYVFKLGKRPYISEFFSQQMALAVKYSFYGIKFDGICYVPISKKSFKKRGFDQGKLLASEISEILKIPFIENQLRCVKKNTGQHNKDERERFKNIKGAFKSNKQIGGKILLVDDIKTTGATLNECAKELISSGADSVYCVTGLITEYKKKKG